MWKLKDVPGIYLFPFKSNILTIVLFKQKKTSWPMTWIFLYTDHDSINFSCLSTSNLKLKWRCSITDKTLINYFLKNRSPDQLFNKEDDIQSKFFFCIPSMWPKEMSLNIRLQANHSHKKVSIYTLWKWKEDNKLRIYRLG